LTKTTFILFLLSFFGLKSIGQKSILAEGNWYKIEIAENGVHKIDKATLQSFGINTDNLNSKSIRFFVSPEKLLPQKNSTFRNVDFVEIPVFSTSKNAIFEKNDYLLFYAENGHSVSLDDSLNLHFHQNPYSDVNYVFMQIGNGESKAIEKKAFTDVSAKKVESLTHFELYDPQYINILNSGREWFGEYVVSEWSKTFQIKGIEKNQSIHLNTKWISQAYENTSLSILSGKTKIGEMPMRKIDYRWNDYFKRYNRAGEISEKRFNFSTDNDEITLTFQLPADIDISSGAYLDLIEFQTSRKIDFYDAQNQSIVLEKGDIQFDINQIPNGSQVWDVSRWYSPAILSPSVSTFYFKKDIPLSKLAFFTPTNPLTPKSIKAIDNQSLHSLESPNLAIIYTNLFKKEAEQLAQFRKSNDGLEVATIDVQYIYNEFSGGKVDPTAIRDFARFLWLKNPDKFKYLLLFGDTNFDIKNNNNLSYAYPERLIPTYESKESLEPIYSYSSDDYFGFLEAHEGDWPEGNSLNGKWQETLSNDHSLDISVGRLPVKERIEAKLLVDKLIHYSSSKKNLGSWKRKISFVADDADLNIHQRDAEVFSDISSTKNKASLANKIYLDAFPQNQTALGERSPLANAAFQDAINKGSLIINFNGHGSVDGWTDEKLLTLNDIVHWRNKDRLPILFTATCEFGRYDNPRIVSGAEAALLNPDGGAIALLTTTRPVFSSTNFKINQAFYNTVFEEMEAGNKLGDIFRITKNGSIEGVVNRNFSLLGDPSMAIAYPKSNIKLESINNKKPEEYTIKGWSKIQIKGSIDDNTFNGNVRISLYDRAIEKSTFGGNNYPKMTFKSIESKLFEGTAKVNNGQFTAEFIVPKTASETLDYGQLYFYAVNLDSTKEAIGGDNSFLIGGTNTEIVNDKTPPTIIINFDKVNNRLLISAQDESGINVSKLLEDNLILILNDTLRIPLNDYYNAIDDFTKGEIIFPFSNLKEGNYTVRLKMADVYNNSSEESLDFTIEQERFKLLHTNLYPNPSGDIVNLEIVHNRNGEDVRFDISFFDSSGKQMYSETKECYLCENKINFGMNLESFLSVEGHYYYKINATQLLNGNQNTKGGRLFFWK
jgi:hypothetical protein